MAWISVHEQVLSGKLRNLSKTIGCSQNEALGILVRLWLWGINNADKNGKIIGADIDDIADSITTGLDKRYKPMLVAEALITVNWIEKNEDAFYLHDWNEWQKQWYKYIETKEKDAERKRRERALKSTEKIVSEADVIDEENKTNNSTALTAKKRANDYTTDFEEFWNIYPRKIDKGGCYKKYQARLKDGFPFEVMLEAAKNYASECKKYNTEEKFIKHGKTFLSDSTPFLDYIKKPQQESSKVADDNINPFSEYLD